MNVPSVFRRQFVAIPWLEFLFCFCLLSIALIFIFPLGATYLLHMADKSLSGLWQVLTWFSHLHFSVWAHIMPNLWICAITCVGIILLLLPSGMPGRWLGAVWLLPFLFYQPEKPAAGEVWLTVLDVGQGLSVVAQTKSHVLVYDAGPKFGDNFDMGESVVLPFLQTIGANKIDMLVISHGDNDHIGGADALMHALPISAIQTSEPDLLSSPVTQNCLAGTTWEWDKVHFTFLYPEVGNFGNGNNSSCVLLIESNRRRILLTGDIEKEAENNLLSRSPAQLAANILVAPHHGSKTSGQRAFVQAVHPDYVLYATGFRNRYRFPHARVVKAYEEVGSVQLNTAESGAIMFKLGMNNLQVELYRKTHKHYWNF